EPALDCEPPQATDMRPREEKARRRMTRMMDSPWENGFDRYFGGGGGGTKPRTERMWLSVSPTESTKTKTPLTTSMNADSAPRRPRRRTWRVDGTGSPFSSTSYATMEPPSWKFTASVPNSQTITES